MSVPAGIMGDKIMGMCPSHLAVGPLGAPIKAPPLPFQAPVVLQTATKVFIMNKLALTVGSKGLNVPPHVPPAIHPSDPSLAPPMQFGVILMGAPKVLIEGKPAAKMGSKASLCTGVPMGTLTATGTKVLIG